METTGLEIILNDTYANLKAGEPYTRAIGGVGLFAYASDQDAIYRVKTDGTIGDKVGKETIYRGEVGPVSTQSINIPEMTATAEVDFIFLDNTFLYPSEYTQGLGQITVNVADLVDNSYLYYKFSK